MTNVKEINLWNAAVKIGAAIAEPGPRAIILTYHRVASLSYDPNELAVTPKHFEEQMRALRDHYNPVSTDALVAMLRDGRIVDRAVAITFDDGYADNLDAAAVLGSLGIPATFFVATGPMGGHEYWWDDLERAPGMTPDTYHAWCNGLKHMGPAGRDKALSAIKGYAPAAPPRPDHRPMTPDEVRQLAESPIAAVGSHGVTHSIPLDKGFVSELSESKKILETTTGSPVRAFSYPYGEKPDIGSRYRAVSRRYEYACANYAGAVHNWMRRVPYMRWMLPRRVVKDWDGAGFIEKLNRWYVEG